MKNRYADAIGSFVFLGLMALAIYAGLFCEIVGFNNIGFTALWLVGILLLLGSISEAKKPPKENNMGKYLTYALRTTYILLVLTIIYQGEIVLGMIYAVASLGEYGKRLKAEETKTQKQKDDTDV